MDAHTIELIRSIQGEPHTTDSWQQIAARLADSRRQLAADGDQGSLDQLVELLGGWARDTPDGGLAAHALVAAGDIAAQDRDEWDRAIELYEQALARDPFGAVALQRLEPALRLGGHPARLDATLVRRAELLQEAGADAAACGDAWARLATFRIQELGDTDGAIKAYETALEHQPTKAVIEGLAELLSKRRQPGDLEEAADLYYALGDVTEGDEGIAYLEQALDRWPLHEEALTSLERRLPESERLMRLVPRWRAFVADAPDGPKLEQARRDLVLALESLGRGDEAKYYMPASEPPTEAAPAPASSEPESPQQAIASEPPAPGPQAAAAEAAPEPQTAAAPAAGPTARAAEKPKPQAPAARPPRQQTLVGWPTPPKEPAADAAPPAAATAGPTRESAAQQQPAATSTPAPIADSLFPTETEIRTSQTSKTRWLALGAVAAAAVLTLVFVTGDEPAAEPVATAATRGVAEDAPPEPAAAERRQAEPLEADSFEPGRTKPSPAADAPPGASPRSGRAKPSNGNGGGPSARLIPRLSHYQGASINRRGVVRALKGSMPKVKRCYQQARARKPRLKGRLVPAWRVRAKGKADNIRIVRGTIRDPVMRRCVRKAIYETRFPAPKGRQARVWMPMVFRP